MSIFDSLDNFVDSTLSLFEDLGEAVGSFITDISDTLDEIGFSELKALAVPLAHVGAVLFPELAIPELIVVITDICQIVSDVAKLFVGDDGMENDDLGMRASYAEKSPEQFDNYGEYVNYLKSVEPDYDRLNALTAEDRLPYTLMGASIREQQISEKTGVSVPVQTYACAEKINMPAQEVYGTIQAASDKGIDKLPALNDYFDDKKLDSKTQGEMRECLEEGISKANPELSQDEVEEKIFDYTESFQSDTIEG